MHCLTCFAKKCPWQQRTASRCSQICRAQILHRWTQCFHNFTRKFSKNTARNEKCSLLRRFQLNQKESKQSRIRKFVRTWNQIAYKERSPSEPEGPWFTMERGIRLLYDRCKLIQKIQITGNVTQRVLHKMVAPLFDPLGFIAPLTVRLGKMLQAAWNQGPKCDKPLLLDNIQDFSRLREEVPAFKDVKIPGNYFLDETVSSNEFHTFTDASEYALSAVSYMRMEYSDRSISVEIAMGRSRVALIKKMTIPNLEFQAAVYGAQLGKFIKEEKDIEYSVFLVWQHYSPSLAENTWRAP